MARPPVLPLPRRSREVPLPLGFLPKPGRPSSGWPLFFGKNLRNFVPGVTRNLHYSFKAERREWLRGRRREAARGEERGCHWMKPEMGSQTLGCLVLLTLCVGQARADEVNVAGSKATITRADCQALATYHKAPGVDYQPGVDVNGHYVAPADVPSGPTYHLPDRVEFDVVINPLNYGQANASGKFNNTGLPVGHVVIDMRTGRATMDGQPMQDTQQQYIEDICRKSGY